MNFRVFPTCQKPIKSLSRCLVTSPPYIYPFSLWFMNNWVCLTACSPHKYESAWALAAASLNFHVYRVSCVCKSNYAGVSLDVCLARVSVSLSTHYIMPALCVNPAVAARALDFFVGARRLICNNYTPRTLTRSLVARAAVVSLLFFSVFAHPLSSRIEQPGSIILQHVIKQTQLRLNDSLLPVCSCA